MMTTLIAALSVTTVLTAQPAMQRQDRNQERQPEKPRQEWVNEWGTQWIELQTDDGPVIVYLPEDIIRGDKISGSVFPGTSDRRINDRAVNDLTLDINGKSFKVGDNMFTIDVPTDSDRIDIVVRDRESRSVARTEARVEAEGRSMSGFSAARFVQSGTGLEVMGAFDGDRANTSAKVNGRSVGVLTESPRAAVVAGFVNKVGPSQLVVKERNQPQFEQQVNSLVLTILPPETPVRRGGKAFVEVHIDGLEDMDDEVFPINVVLTADNPKAVKFVDSNDTEITLQIRPGDIRRTEWQKATQIQAIGAGSYGLSAKIY